MNKTLLILVAALSLTELIHNIFEIWGMRQKVKWLKARINKQPHGDWPINVNTKLKTVMVHSVLFSLSAGLGLLLLMICDFSITTLFYLIIGLLVVNYAQTTVVVDAYHDEIGELMKHYPKQK